MIGAISKCSFIFVLLSGAAHARSGAWSYGEAHVLPAGRWELGLFAPLAYGLTDRVELATHPLLDVLDPALTVKVAWLDRGPWSFASEHTLSYPTQLIKTLSAPGTGGLWPDEAVVPQIIGFDTDLMASYSLGSHVFLARVGALMAARFGASTLGTVDMWFLYPRTAHWSSGATIRFGLAAHLQVSDALDVEADVDLYTRVADDAEDGSPVLEQSARIIWRVSCAVRLQLGYAISGGDLPGPDDWAILPTFDARFAF